MASCVVADVARVNVAFDDVINDISTLHRYVRYPLACGVETKISGDA